MPSIQQFPDGRPPEDDTMPPAVGQWLGGGPYSLGLDDLDWVRGRLRDVDHALALAEAKES